MSAAERDYSQTPLPKKLGIKEGSRVAVLAAPNGFIRTLGTLPPDARILPTRRSPLDVVLIFATSRAGLARRFGRLARVLAPAGGLWVAWPKKASGVVTDLSFEHVQQIGLGAGLVDNKSCAIDETWQALRFVLRLKDRPSGGRRPR